jgi:hypothetical protein
MVKYWFKSDCVGLPCDIQWRCILEVLEAPYKEIE